MKVSQLVAEILAENGVDQVFGVSGGASLHLLKAINDHEKLNLTCLHHEQSVAMAAEAYSRVSGRLGVGVVTSGPGATNLITGIAGAFYDSVPVVYITGQVSTSRMKGELQVRQIGFQETPIVKMVEMVTKYAVTVQKAEDLEPELRKAIDISQTGRKGPVLIDIPDNIQRLDYELKGVVDVLEQNFKETIPQKNVWSEVGAALANSLKPIIVCGAGIQMTSNRDLLIKKLTSLRIPTALTWGAKDLIPGDSSFLLGTFGTHGERHVNIALNEADFILSIGSRLDLKATGTPVSSFAPAAKKIMLDIDNGEISKFVESGLKIENSIEIDIGSTDFEEFLEYLKFDDNKLRDWERELCDSKQALSVEKRFFSGDGINPYLFIESLTETVRSPTNLIVDTGCAIAWTMQVWKTKQNQRIFHDFNNTAMGWSIPATISSALANPEIDHLCLIGDGSLMMALSDLATLAEVKSPIKVIILNNSGYGMIKQTQDQWFLGEYFASSSGDDLHFPDFHILAKAMGFNYYYANSDSQSANVIEEIMRDNNPLILELQVQSDARVIPIVKFGNPNHIMEP